MIKYWKIWWRISNLCLMREMIYKTNFLLGFATAFVYISTQIGFYFLLFTSGGNGTLAGYTFWQMMFVLCISQGVYLFLFVFLLDSLSVLREQIYSGQIDLFLMKPVNSFFILIFQRFAFRSGLAIILYLTVLFPYVLYKGQFVFDWLDLLKIFYVFIFSILLSMIMYIISVIIEFYFPRFYGLYFILSNMSDISRYPAKIYPAFLQYFLLFIWPFMLLTNPIYMIFDGKFGWQWISITLFVLIVFSLIMIGMWRGGLKRYQSTA